MLRWSQIQELVWTGNKCRTTKDAVQANMVIKEPTKAAIVLDLVIKR